MNEYFSSWSKLLKPTVYVLRFSKMLPNHPEIQNTDLTVAELKLVQTVQKYHFADIKNICNNTVLRSNLRRLNSFIQERIFRVGGRLSNFILSFAQKHPILLPKTDPLTKLLIDYYHKKYCHTGPNLLHALLRQNYWILSVRGLIGQRIWKCNHCFRLNPKSNFPIMSELTKLRLFYQPV